VIRRALLIAIGLISLTSGTTTAHAQARRPQAEVTSIAERDASHAGTEVRVALHVRLPEGLHMQSNTPRDPTLIPTVLSIEAPSGVTVSEIVYPPSTDLKQAGQDQLLAVFEREFTIGVRLTLGPGVAAGDLVVPARMRYQACDATVCYLPQRAETRWTLHVVPASAPTPAVHADVFGKIAFGTGERPATSPQPPATAVEPPATSPEPPASSLQPPSVDAALDGLTVLGVNGGYMFPREFLRFVHDAENGVKRRGLLEGRGALAILVIIFFGGLALNLTPCVLPMIPINLAIIGAGAQAGSRSRGFLLGAAYGAAMAIVYGVLGVVVILTAGTFGTINASPWFNAAIAALFIALALAMFDVITIDFSGLSSGFRAEGSSRGTFLLAFGMGGVAALLAGACVAPVVIEVVLFSSNLYAKGTRIALALPFFLGVGMAVPWPIAGAGLASLPRPGAWMVRVKQVFGVLILATAVYYGYESYSIFANRWVDPGAVASSVQQKLKAGWHASLAEGLDAARREHKPVLIDLWATWCKNCLTMDKTTLEDPAVTAALAGYVKIKCQAEDPEEPTTKRVMQRFNAVGLPTYVILR
jgi:cytochrome c biogenesis protein CcdA